MHACRSTLEDPTIRDYVHVLDLAEAHRLALEATEPGDAWIDGRLLAANLGSGAGFSVREVLAEAERVIGRPVPQSIGERRAGDPPELVADITRARETLGWTPERSTLEEMIGSAWALREGRSLG